MVGRLLRETVSEEPPDGQAVGAAGGNAALAADTFRKAHDEHAHEDSRIHRRTSALSACQSVMRDADTVHRLRETHLFQKRREFRVECIVQPGDDFLRSQPEILLSRRGNFAEYFSHEEPSNLSPQARPGKPAAPELFQQAPGVHLQYPAINDAPIVGWLCIVACMPSIGSPRTRLACGQGQIAQPNQNSVERPKG